MSHCKNLKGKGSPLFLFHGWGQSHESLQPLAELLKPWASPYLFDLPGFGASPPPPKAWSAFDYADHFVNIMDENGIEKAALLGHSFGGKVAMCLAAKYPQRVEKLILIASSGIPPKRSLSKKIQLFGIKWGGKSLAKIDYLCSTSLFSTYFTPKFGSRDYQQAGAMRPTLIRAVNEDITPHLIAIRSPTLLLWGGKDTETPPEMGRRFADLIPQAKLHCFPHHTHFPFQDAGSHLLASYIGRFL